MEYCYSYTLQYMYKSYLVIYKELMSEGCGLVGTKFLIGNMGNKSCCNVKHGGVRSPLLPSHLK